MRRYSRKEVGILTTIMDHCATCPKRLACVEMECTLFRIENIITGEHKLENLRVKKKGN